MTAVLFCKGVRKELLLAFILNICCGCAGSSNEHFSKNQSKTKFILVVAGLCSQFRCEKPIITYYVLFQYKYVLAQMNLSEHF